MKRGRPAGAVSRYSAIAEDIAKRLAAGEWAMGASLPSGRNLSKAYGVSLLTMQQALKKLREDGLVRIMPRKKAVAAPGADFDSVFHGSLAVVASTDLYQIVASAGYSNEIVRGILQATRGTNRTIAFLQDYRWRKDFPAGLRHLPIQGVLLVGSFPYDLLAQYESLPVPVVLLDNPAGDLKLHSISVASFEAARAATKKLIELGHRRLAFVRPFMIGKYRHQIDPDALERGNGFMAACREAGLRPDEYRIFTAGFNAPGPTIRALLKARPRFTAVLVSSFPHAQSLQKLAQMAGLRIPEDLSVAGIRDSGWTGRDWAGACLDFVEFGRRGVELLLRKPTEPEHILVQGQWHEGDSVARPPQS